VNLPYFSAPGTTPPYNDETLDVDLRFLTGTDYTIFAVERRWADPAAGAARTEEIIGTEMSDESAKCPASGYQIPFGYVYYDGYPALGFESMCYTPYSGTRGRVPSASVPPPSPAAFDMLRFAKAVAASPTVWQNGVQVNVGGASGGAGSGFSGGAIGRGLRIMTYDDRYVGDIAEIIVYDVGLTDPERLTMDSYLKTHWNLP
jgi:hypothetical protein